MSIINKMLKDLDQQQQPEKQQLKGEMVLNESQSHKILWLLVFIIMALLLWNFKGFFIVDNPPQKISKIDKKKDAKKTKIITVAVDKKNISVVTTPSKNNVIRSDEIDQKKNLGNISEKKKDTKIERKITLIPDRKIKTKFPVAEPKKKPKPKKTTEIISITKNTNSPEKTAKQLWKLAELHPEKAEKLLLEAINLSSNLHGARLQLISLLVSQRRISMAENVIDKGLFKYPENSEYIEWKARLRIAAKDQKTGLQWLLKSHPEINTHVSYYGLLAAVFSQLKYHNKAAETYADLVKVQPEHGPWILGLAISKERLGEKTSAINLYKKAKSSKGLTARAQLFIQQKLDKLES